MENNERIEVNMAPWNYHNGIVIICRTCGADFEETCEGNYPPLEYEDERYSRRCKRCVDYYGK